MKEPGYTAVTKMLARLGPLADHQLRFHPGALVLRMYRNDYTLLEKHPRAAKMHGFEIREGAGGIYYRGMHCVPDAALDHE